MMKTKALFAAFAAVVCVATAAQGGQQQAVSPDGRNRITYSEGMVTVSRDGRTLFGPQPAVLRLDHGKAKVELCARNDGVAYRFATDEKGEITVLDETAALVFPSPDTELWVGYNWCDNPKDPKQDKLQHGCASAYTRTTPSSFVPDGRRIAYLPLTVRYPDGTAALVTETDLRDYAGWHLKRRGSETRRIDGVSGKYPVRNKELNKGWKYRRVKDRHKWIVKTRGRRTFPWRVFVLADSPIGLVEQRIAHDLAAPPKGDFSWVKPGMCTWEWWCAWRLDGVPFTPGINTATYKAYIDFAAEYGLGWLLVDEGWCKTGDVFSLTDGFDLDAIVSHAASRGVRVMLWTTWRVLDGRQDKVFAAFAKRGVAGFKVDFMDRDDAEMMRFMEKTLSVAAKHRLAIDFHGCGKPSGLETTYPNLVGMEGVRGLELMKLNFSKGEDFMTHDCMVPFTRAPLGHVDYTPGAMRNLRRDEWQPDKLRPASQGTRVHQMAIYTLFPVPLQMMCDSPSAYRRNPECARFIASVPTVWDETKGLCGEIGKFAAVARRRGDAWHIGAITDWSAREIEIDTSFLGGGEWEMEVFADADDADRFPERWTRTVRTIRAGEKIKVRMAPGGGWTAVIGSGGVGFNGADSGTSFFAIQSNRAIRFDPSADWTLGKGRTSGNLALHFVNGGKQTLEIGTTDHYDATIPRTVTFEGGVGTNNGLTDGKLVVDGIGTLVFNTVTGGHQFNSPITVKDTATLALKDTAVVPLGALNFNSGTTLKVEQTNPTGIVELGGKVSFAGDSTLDDHGRVVDPYASWGTRLEDYMRSGCSVDNYAKSGASTKSFRANGYWSSLLAAIRPGDFVGIQFGHNDQKAGSNFAAPDGLFRDNVRQFVSEVRALGGKPILLSPIVRGTFDSDGNLYETQLDNGTRLSQYATAMRELSVELGTDFVDMNALTHDLLVEVGKDATANFFAVSAGVSGDYTHPIPAGADAFARLFIKNVKDRGLEVAALFT